MKFAALLPLALVIGVVSDPVHCVVLPGDGAQCGIFEQRDRDNNPRAVTIKQLADNYSLKIDHYGKYDAVGIYSSAPDSTVLGVTGENVSFSTFKATNTAAQVMGAVVGVVGRNADRTAPCLGVQNSSAKSGIGYLHTAMHPSAVGFVAKAVAGQTGNGFEFRDERGNVIFKVDPDGVVWAKAFKKL